MKTVFKGILLDVTPVGELNVTFPQFNDHLKWNKLTVTTHNLIMGNPYIDIHGTIRL